MAIPMEACFAHLVERWTDEVVVTSAGNSSEMWWKLTGETEKVFYLEASMSLASLFAAGIAYGIPRARVWAFSGDGAQNRYDRFGLVPHSALPRPQNARLPDRFGRDSQLPPGPGPLQVAEGYADSEVDQRMDSRAEADDPTRVAAIDRFFDCLSHRGLSP